MSIRHEKDKLINLLGGYTKDEVTELISTFNYRDYWRGRRAEAKLIIDKANNIYGADKQIWINIIYDTAVKDYIDSDNNFADCFNQAKELIYSKIRR